MARKDYDDDRRGDNLLWSTIVDSLKIILVEGFKEKINDVLDLIDEGVERIQRKMMIQTAYFFLMGLSIIFLCIAAINLMQQYLSISRGWSYFIVGGIVLFGALLVKKSKEDIY